jgi:uncharacterized protein YkwD
MRQVEVPSGRPPGDRYGPPVRRLLPIAIVIALLLGSATADASPAPRAERKLTHLINRARVTRGLPRLARSDSLVAFARDEAKRMVRLTTLVHSSTKPCSYWGEDIGATPYGPWALFKAWMASAEHRANILNGRFRRIGVGGMRSAGYLWGAVELCR